jgi:hypothetical protein
VGNIVKFDRIRCKTQPFRIFPSIPMLVEATPGTPRAWWGCFAKKRFQGYHDLPHPAQLLQ